MIGRNIIQKIYDLTLRDHLPLKYRLLAGVAVPDAPLFDFSADDPSYKLGLMSAIREGVEDGDRVHIIGYGRGVSTIHAFDAGASHITAYEASEKMIQLANSTTRVNRPFECDLRVQHAIVGEAVDIYGDATGADAISPDELCDGDLLILDCEGSEISILNNLGTFPRKIICESHPAKGAHHDEILEVIDNQYDVKLFEYDQGPSDKKVLLAEK